MQLPCTRGSKISKMQKMSNFKSSSNNLQFDLYWVYRILRPIMKKSARFDCQFNSYVFFYLLVGRFWEYGPKKYQITNRTTEL